VGGTWLVVVVEEVLVVGGACCSAEGFEPLPHPLRTTAITAEARIFVE